MQLAYFFSFLAAGGVFLMLSFTIFLPTIIIAPSKFAMAFTLGCLLVMTAFSALRGWKQQFQHMMSKERLPFSACGYHKYSSHACHCCKQLENKLSLHQLGLQPYYMTII